MNQITQEHLDVLADLDKVSPNRLLIAMIKDKLTNLYVNMPEDHVRSPKTLNSDGISLGQNTTGGRDMLWITATYGSDGIPHRTLEILRENGSGTNDFDRLHYKSGNFPLNKFVTSWVKSLPKN